MNSEKWRQIKELFNQAVELDSADCEMLLNNQTDNEVEAEVRKLLDAEKANNFGEPVANLSQIWQDEKDARNLIGKEVGGYKIIREIGHGGMGVVFEAVRNKDDFSKTVALKLLKRGMDSDAMLRRFSREQQILASLEHPNIAHLVDGGRTADGTSFFALEFVNGQPIDEFCDERHLTIAERLQLFLQICNAVSFAHSRLVVHRDLKPSNILVTNDGTAKLLDFGIAKIVSNESNLQTQIVTTLGMMTPKYASPEQISGEIVSTSSDIYSLGLILYELLTGVPAYNFPNNRPDEIAKIICENEPIRPSSAVSGQWSVVAKTSEIGQSETQKKTRNPQFGIRNLKGDLDTIILKALEKQPARRYASVEQFARDISRHLEGLPVIARAATFSYRAEKFLKRNRVSVFAGSLIFLSLVGGITATTIQSFRAEHQKQLADKRFSQVRRIASDVLLRYNDALTKLSGSTEIRASLIKDATGYLDSLNSEQEHSAEIITELAEAYLRVGNIQGESYSANLGDTEGAFASYSKALKLCGKLEKMSADYSTTTKLTTRILLGLGKLQIRRGEFDSAEDHLEEAVKFGENLLLKESQTAESKRTLSKIYIALGDAISRNNKKYPNNSQLERSGPHFEKSLEIINSPPIDLKTSENADIQIAASANQRIGNNYTYRIDHTQKFTEFSAKLFELSVERYRQATELFAELVRREPTNIEYQRNYADELLMQAFVKSRSESSVSDALINCQIATATLERIGSDDPKNVEAQFDIAMAYYQTSNVLQGANKQVPEALKLMLRSAEILEKLNKQNPNSDEFHVNLINAYRRLFQIYNLTGNPAKAEFYRMKTINN